MLYSVLDSLIEDLHLHTLHMKIGRSRKYLNKKGHSHKYAVVSIFTYVTLRQYMKDILHTYKHPYNKDVN